MTRVGALTGTLEYMAPEARLGDADAKSDQFSFAMSMWESLTGVAPFDVHAGPWRLPKESSFNGADVLDPDVRLALEHALAFEPAHRFRSMRYVVRALERATRTAPRRRQVVAAVAVAGVVAAGGAAIGLTNGDGPQDSLAGPVEVRSVVAQASGNPPTQKQPDVQPALTPPPKKTPRLADGRVDTGVHWWCMCYEYRNAATGEWLPATACRRSSDRCEALKKKMGRRNPDAITRWGSAEPVCTPIAGALPWQQLGREDVWSGSDKAGAWRALGHCVLE